ncbi:chemotaxis protein CheB [Cupriavidus sp. AU9028]|uniref:chemotaxis protein CheB n=1 Tax=Cupriavidus sp. AU9028 TaxID=2871157 RepID=UPI001C9836BD|nr:chemotaxis protein CheB [Cupriavidus sp. AU9028]MBY4897450.1 PAS domain S-box protein [Cupriavidus sp. AU9028]
MNQQTSNTPDAEEPEIDHISPSSLRFPVVGIGASAGGIRALQTFFEQCPARCDMAFVVILHLSPRHESNAAAILQRSTSLRVVQVTSPTPIEKDTIYIIPPNRDLTMNDGYVRVTESSRPRGAHVAIDLFFRTLAKAHRQRAFAIVMSGTGSDGAVGMATVKEMGGVTMAQLPEDAEHDGMPRSAIDTGVVDVVLPAAELPQKLLDLWANAREIELPEPVVRTGPAHAAAGSLAREDAEQALREIIALLHNRTGHDFRHYKRATVLRRIERRMQVNALPRLPAYRDYLRDNAQETPALLKDMLIGVTNFFRDREAFEAMERDVVPAIFASKSRRDDVRAWVAGCATGEEAYSVAMLLCEHSATLTDAPGIQVFATDIDESAIRTARAGAYPESIMADVIPARLRQFFSKETPYYRIKKTLRDHVLFAAHNVLRDPPFSHLDLVTCRNLLIYLDREVQREVLEMFHFALRPGGYLLLGSSESADAASRLFTPVDKRHRLYQAKVGTHASRYAPALPLGAQLPKKPPSRPYEREPERRQTAFSTMHQRALELYAPPSVIVNYDSEIVHLSDRAGRFLRQPGGVPSNNLLALVLPELRLELRTALYQASQSGKSVEARRTRLDREGRSFYVNIVVRPFRDPDGSADFMLVLFDEVEDTMRQDRDDTEDSDKDPMLAQLESELQQTKEQLQSTIEQAETSMEELKASNEELQAINEELRSASEELETSKEELQSINEELITVNHELKSKVEETGKVNDDLQNLIASTDIATVFVDSAVRIKRYTPRAADIFSIIPNDVGRSLLDITHRLDYDSLADDVALVFQTLRTIEREIASIDDRRYIARLLPYRTTEDRIEGAVLTFIDITLRRQAEERLRAGEERLRLVLENAKDYAVMTLDAQGLVTSWNKGAERMFGYSEEEMLGKPVDLIFTPEDRAAGAPEDERRRAVTDGRAEDERWHQHRDGPRLFCSGVMTPLQNSPTGGFAKIARDVTGGKRVDDEREVQLIAQREANARAQAQNQLKDEFLAVLSHELKHPLNLIHVNAEILGRLPSLTSSEIGLRATETIQRAVLGQAKIIDDLLDFSRVHTGKLALQRKPMDLTRTVEMVAETLRRDRDGLGVTVCTEGLEQPLWILADNVRIEQIVWNLVSNAMKFTPRGGTVTLSLAIEDSMARLDVVDNGMGIDADSLPYIFDMFSRSTQARRSGKSGLGIGLALVRELVDMHGGRVEAHSEGEGHGARFSVWLPSAQPGEAETPQPNKAHRLTGLRILLVDDTEDTLEGFSALLTLEGADVVTANSGEAALEQAQRQTFDLLLSDIGMPGMDGYELLGRLRQQPATSNLMAVALTGLGRQRDIQRVREAGFAAHISKPVALTELMHTLAGLGLLDGTSAPRDD